MLLSVQELEDKPMNKPVVAKKRPASTCTSELRISVGGDVHCMPPTAASGGGAGMFSPMHGLSDSDCESEASSCYSKHHTRRQQHQQRPGFIFVRTFFCPKRKMFTFSRAHSYALTNATRRHEYFRGQSRLLQVPGVLVSFLELCFVLKGLFERLRAPSQSQKGHFSKKTKLKK